MAPPVSAVHAGRECGAIGGIYPEMDMIRTGPTMSDVHSIGETWFIAREDKVMGLSTAVLPYIPER